MSDGWAVSVKMGVLGGGQSERIFYAAIPDKFAAEAAVKKRLGLTDDVLVKAVSLVSAASFKGMNFADGHIDQWIGAIP
jgi:hypothetical protein